MDVITYPWAAASVANCVSKRGHGQAYTYHHISMHANSPFCSGTVKYDQV